MKCITPLLPERLLYRCAKCGTVNTCTGVVEAANRDRKKPSGIGSSKNIEAEFDPGLPWRGDIECNEPRPKVWETLHKPTLLTSVLDPAASKPH